MAINNLFSKRNKQAPDVFTYDQIPKKLRIQVLRIWQKLHDINSRIPNTRYNFFKEFSKIEGIFCDEYGLKELITKGYNQYTERESYDDILKFFELTSDMNEALDIIELVSNAFLKYPVDSNDYSTKEAIDDLNARFLENGVGFEFRSGEIIRIDNKLLHHEIVIPALHFLSAPEFHNANDEYMIAHDHFKNGHTKDCLNNCLKALETTLKIICDLNGWTYKPSDTANALIKVVIDNKLIPEFLQHFSSLRSSLESGVPTFRNKLGGHGQGPQKIEVPMHYASYMLYLTGTTINFLVSCHQELKP